MTGEPPRITELLVRSRSGEKAAMDALIPLVYQQLRGIAERCLSGERIDHTLRPDALVNEAYLRLVQVDVEWKDRVHFFSVAARMMRRILVDHARMLGRARRGGEFQKLALDEALTMAVEKPAVVLALDEALDRLAQVDERRSKILEMLYFGGLARPDAAEALGISESTLNRELKLARAWLYHELSAAEPG